MIDARFQHMADPGTHPERERSRFRSNSRETMKLLERELRHLGAADVVIEAGFTRGNIRNDGWPRSSAKPEHPAVRISVETPDGPLSFPCDAFDNYEDNIRAIALTLERLRAVDRYGVSVGREQYKGWAQLPAADGEFANKQEALRYLEKMAGNHIAGVQVDDLEIITPIYRIAAKKHHPDAGGEAGVFERINAAYKMLKGD